MRAVDHSGRGPRAVCRATLFAALGFCLILGFPRLSRPAWLDVNTPGDPTGQWRGRVVIQGDTVEAVLDLGRVGSRWVGECDVPDFGAENYPVQVEVTGSTVALHFSGVDADYQGKLTADGQHLDGVLHFPDSSASPDDHTSAGDTASPDDNISRDHDTESSRHAGDQSVRFTRVGEVKFSAGFLQLETATDQATRVRTLSDDGSELRARFNAARNELRLVLLLAPT